MKQAEGTTDQQPDGLLYKPRIRNNGGQDLQGSDQTGQQSKADYYQYQVLVDKIKDVDPTAKIWYHPLLVGAAGSICSSVLCKSVLSWYLSRITLEECCDSCRRCMCVAQSCVRVRISGP